MNVTKKTIIRALNYLNEYPKSSVKKDDLIDIYKKMFDKENIGNLCKIINITMYSILKQLEKSNSGIYIENTYKKDIDFLEKTLIIEKINDNGNKTYIKFIDGMKANFANFINEKNEKQVKNNKKIVDLINNIIGTYGIIQIDYELSNMVNSLLNDEIDVELLFELIDYNIDLRYKVSTATANYDEIYLIHNSIYNLQDIMDERIKRKLDYKHYTVDELKVKNIETVINCEEAKKLIRFLEKINYESPIDLVYIIIHDIMANPQVDIKNFMNVQDLNFENIDQVNEYLQLTINLYNSIPQFSLCGYSPNDLMKIEIQKKQEQKRKEAKSKIGRNEPCICGSGKKYKYCCMNKVISVDFSKEKKHDCVNEEEAKMFFYLKNILFDYINQKYHINKELEDFNDICGAFPEEIIDIRKKLWEDESIINEYIKENPNGLNIELIETIKQWNHKKVNKTFTLYKYENEYAVFMDDDYIYYVKGLRDSIRDMIPEKSLPIFVETVLLPLNNQIIYDSYIQQYNISFGNNMRKEMDRVYIKLHKNKKVKFEL